MVLQWMVDDFTVQYQARYGYAWRYEGATVQRDGKTYSLVTPEGVHYFLSTSDVAKAHLESYLETGRGNMAMCRAGVS
jgi:hypothetical protein